MKNLALFSSVQSDGRIGANYNDNVATDRKSGVLIKANKTSLDENHKERKSRTGGLYKGNATDLVFLKFHKVSGETLKNALEHALPNKSSWPDNSVCGGEPGPQNSPFNHGIVYRFRKEGRKGLERCFDWSDSVVISMLLRDPLERVLSWMFSSVGGLNFSNKYDTQLGLEHLQKVSNDLTEGGVCLNIP